MTKQVLQQALEATREVAREVFKDSCSHTLDAIGFFHAEMELQLHTALAQQGEQQPVNFGEFAKWHWKACDSSQPDDWMMAALAAQRILATSRPDEATPAAQPDWSLLDATQESLREHMAMVKELQAKLAQQGEQQPVAYFQVYRCGIKSRAKIRAEIPREKQGWWADVCPGETLSLRQAVQSDIDRCSLNAAHTRNPDDYMCETFAGGALVAKYAIEFMNPEQNVFACVAATPSTPHPHTRTVVQQMVDSLENVPFLCETDRAAIAAGQKLLKELK